MPQKTAARLRALLEELDRVQSESGHVAGKARQDLAELLRRSELNPVGTSGTPRRKVKAGRKKR